MPADTELPPDLEAAWATIAAAAETIGGRPNSTIKPRDKSMGSTSHGLLDEFLDEARQTGSARLELGPVLGEGGMGVVRLASQRTIGREVAVKSLRTHQRRPGPTLKLLQEAWTAARLEHPNIVPVYDITVDDEGSPLIVLKRIGGESWATMLRDEAGLRERHGVDDALEWHLQVLINVCNAVHYAHDRGVLHLDLKPDNVMLGSHGEVYVVDWGIALALHDDSGRLPLAKDNNELLGTPSYMAPEMLAADGSQLGPHTDVYLLGAMLYELLAGHPPHRGETLMEVVHAALHDQPELPEDVPAELADICRRAMATKPEARPAGVEQLRRELLAFLRHRESDRMATRAQTRLVELQRVLADAEGEQPVGHDELFGEVRFGFEQALASWPDNAAARSGLNRAIELMVEHELAHGDPQVAATLAGRTEGLPAELVARLEQALARRRAGIDELLQLRHDQDLTIGQRTRVFVTSVLGLVWTVTPFLEQFVFRHSEGDRSWAYLSLPIVSLAILAGLAIWARDSLSRTRVNRVVVATLAMGLLAQLALMIGGSWLGLSYYDSTAILPLLWSVMVAMIALTFEPRAAPIALSYAVGFFLAVRFPELRFLVIGICNLVFLVVLVIAWWPQRLRGPIPETDHRQGL